MHKHRATHGWFLLRFAAKLAAGEPGTFTRLQGTPSRVAIELRPVAVAVSHDSRNLPRDGRGLPAPHEA